VNQGSRKDIHSEVGLAQAILVVFLFVMMLPMAACAGSAAMAQWQLPSVSYPESNPYNEAKARLGQQLFFDPRLSDRRMRSCANCHHPGLSWADALPYAMGSRQALSRHTPSLVNIAFSKVYFWDGRASSIEHAIQQHLLLPGLMYGGRAKDIVTRIGSLSGYRRQFTASFGNSGVSIDNIAAALATFVRGIVSRNSPFDRWIAGNAEAIPASAKRGFRLFTGKAGCVSCHQAPAFNDSDFHNTGLNSLDPGRFEIQREPKYHNAFKTPGLRQIAITAPYMHNGSKSSLEEVIDFYDRGGDRHADNNQLVPLHLNSQEKQELIAFLKSLTGKPVQTSIPPLPVEQISRPADYRNSTLLNWQMDRLLQRTMLQSINY